MLVTEFALIRLLKPSDNQPDVLELLAETKKVQDDWVDRHQPHLREKGKSVSTMYMQQDGSEPNLLITALWDSPEGHGEWMQSTENQALMGKVGVVLSTEDDAVVVFHLNATGQDPQPLSSDLFLQEPFQACRVSVDTDQKATVDQQYRQLEAELSGASSTNQLWAGWRIERTDDREELVVFWGPSIKSERLESFFNQYQDRNTRTFKAVA